MLRDQGHAVETVDGGQAAMDRLSDRGRPAGRRGAVRRAHARRDRPRPAAVDEGRPGAVGDPGHHGVGARATRTACWRASRPGPRTTSPARCGRNCCGRGSPAAWKRSGSATASGSTRARIDRLVHAMFPPAAVAEWRQHEAIRPQRHDKVGVLFTDVAGFTAWCEARRDRPEEVVATLQDLITRFEASAAPARGAEDQDDRRRVHGRGRAGRAPTRTRRCTLLQVRAGPDRGRRPRTRPGGRCGSASTSARW